MDWSFLAFVIFSTIAILGSLMVVLQKSPVASAFSLILVFFSFAGLYALLGAHFIAALQILVYTGAIMVLFVFVIMLLGQDQKIKDLKESSLMFKGSASVMGVVFLLILVQAITKIKESTVVVGEFSEKKIDEMGGNVRVIAESLFNDHIFQFELVSFLILGAIIATISLAKRKHSFKKEISHE